MQDGNICTLKWIFYVQIHQFRDKLVNKTRISEVTRERERNRMLDSKTDKDLQNLKLKIVFYLFNIH